MGISTEQRLHRNLTPTQLYEHALRRGEGIVTNSRGGGGGPFAAMTSPHTGRSPNDKFLVEEPDSTHRIWWGRSEEHTSELQSQSNLVCRLLLEKKKTKNSSDYAH